MENIDENIIKAQVDQIIHVSEITGQSESLRKAIDDTLEKGGKRGVVGEIREYAGKKFQKQLSGRWLPVKELPHTKKQEDDKITELVKLYAKLDEHYENFEGSLENSSKEYAHLKAIAAHLEKHNISEEEFKSIALEYGGISASYQDFEEILMDNSPTYPQKAYDKTLKGHELQIYLDYLKDSKKGKDNEEILEDLCEKYFKQVDINYIRLMQEAILTGKEKVKVTPKEIATEVKAPVKPVEAKKVDPVKKDSATRLRDILNKIPSSNEAVKYKRYSLDESKKEITFIVDFDRAARHSSDYGTYGRKMEKLMNKWEDEFWSKVGNPAEKLGYKIEMHA